MPYLIFKRLASPEQHKKSSSTREGKKYRYLVRNTGQSFPLFYTFLFDIFV